MAYVTRHLEATECDASLWWAWLSGARAEWRGWVCEIDRILQSMTPPPRARFPGQGEGEGEGERGGGGRGEGGEGGRTGGVGRGGGGQMTWGQLEERLLERFFQVN